MSDNPPENKIDEMLDSLLKIYDENFATKLGAINNQNLVTYIVIMVIALFLAKILDISLSLIFFLLLAFLICYIIYSKKELTKVSTKKENKIKLELIKPKPKKFGAYPDIIDFFFSIREFYYVNPNAFYAVVNNVDNFLVLYEDLINNKMLYCKQNVEVAIDFVRNAQNHLHSIIYNLPIDRVLTEKFHQSLKEFHKLMYQYINRIIKKCNDQFNRKQINNSSGYYDQFGPKPFNYFDNDTIGESRFEFY